MKYRFHHIVLAATLVICWGRPGWTQNSLSAADDFGRISLTPVIPDESLPEAFRNVYESRLQAIASAGGLGGTGAGARFLIAGHAVVVEKNITPTAPPMVALQVDLLLQIADQETQTSFSTFSVESKGVGTNEAKAFINALEALKPKRRDIQTWLAQGKADIIEYYNSQCDFILEKARMLADQRQFDAAIHTLVSVPEVCQACYVEAMRMVAPMYASYQDVLCEENLAKAKAAWATDPTMRGAKAAEPALAQIMPGALCYEEAQDLIMGIYKKLRTDQNLEWEFRLMERDDQLSLEQQRIAAYRAVGVAYGENQPRRRVSFRWLIR